MGSRTASIADLPGQVDLLQAGQAVRFEHRVCEAVGKVIVIQMGDLCVRLNAVRDDL